MRLRGRPEVQEKATKVLEILYNMRDRGKVQRSLSGLLELLAHSIGIEDGRLAI
jgi:hypothetical protein